MNQVQAIISSLQFGQRAMKVKTEAKIVQSIDYKGLSVKLQAQIDELEKKYEELEDENNEIQDENEEQELELQYREEEIKE